MIRKKGYSPSLRDWRVTRHAQRHVQKGVAPSPELVVAKLIGPPQPLDPANPAHAELLLRASNDPRVQEWEAQRQAVEEELTKHPAAWPLLLAFLFLLLVEFAGISELLAAQGMTNPARAIVSLAGSCILFYLIHEAAQHAKKQNLAFFASAFVLGALVFSVGMLRSAEVTTDDASLWENIGAGAFLTIVTLGPGILARKVFSTLAPVRVLRKERQRLRRLINRAATDRQRALKALEQITLNLQWHEQETSQITAVYLLAYREAGGHVPQVAANPYWTNQ